MKRLLLENKLAREIVCLRKSGLYQGASNQRYLLSGNPANLGRQFLIGSRERVRPIAEISNNARCLLRNRVQFPKELLAPTVVVLAEHDLVPFADSRQSVRLPR